MTHHARTLQALLAVGLATGIAATAAPALAHDGEHLPGETFTRTADEAHSRARIGDDLAAMRAAFAPYQDVTVAEAAGYVPASPCEVSPAGGMGVHYLNPALVGSVDPMQPAVLLYEPTGSGELRLVGVEYFVPDADQDLATDPDRPSLLGREFDGPVLGHGPGMPVHYDLHVWLYEANPAGLFEPWNPRVTC
jgi:hypothetical protein